MTCIFWTFCSAVLARLSSSVAAGSLERLAELLGEPVVEGTSVGAVVGAVLGAVLGTGADDAAWLGTAGGAAVSVPLLHPDSTTARAAPPVAAASQGRATCGLMDSPPVRAAAVGGRTPPSLTRPGHRQGRLSRR